MNNLSKFVIKFIIIVYTTIIMNKYCKKKYLSTFSLEKLKQKTILGNEKKKILKLFSDNLTQKNTSKSIELAIELHVSGFFDNLLSKITVFFSMKLIYLNQEQFCI